MGRRRGYNPYASRTNEGGNGLVDGARGKYAKCCFCFFLFKCLLTQHYCRTMGLVWQILQGRRASITSACFCRWRNRLSTQSSDSVEKGGDVQRDVVCPLLVIGVCCRRRPPSFINLLTRVGLSAQQELSSSLTNFDPFAKWHRTSHLSCWDWWGQINFIKIKLLFALMTRW